MTIRLEFWTSDRFKTPLLNVKFIQEMINRVIHSGYKHGGERRGGTRNWIPRCQAALDDYKATGNRERLRDVANFAMYENAMPEHPNAHFHVIASRGFRKVQDF